MEEFDYINRYLNGEMTDQQKVVFFEAMDSDVDLKSHFIEQYDVWIKSGAKSILDPREKEADMKRVWETIHQKVPRRSLATYYRYAAIFIISLLIGVSGTLFLKEYGFGDAHKNSIVYTYSSGQQSNAHITLPDGSVVELNANAKLTYQQHDDTKERLLTLSGEALLNVVHDEKSPFVIDFNGLKVVDVGTVFNVKASKESDVIETTLFEGIVDLQADKQKSVRLKPGEKGIYHKDQHEITVVETDIERELAWRNNRFEFKDQTFEAVINELANWYGVTVIWENEQYKQEPIYYNAKRIIDLKVAMELLQMSIEFKHKMIMEDGVVKTILIY